MAGLKKTKNEWLKVVFTDGELRDFGKELAGKLNELDHTELEKKSMAKSMDNRIASLKVVINELQGKVHDGYIYQNVECRIEYDFTARTKDIIRTDTGEVVKEDIPMTAEELQAELPLDGEGEEAKGGEESPPPEEKKETTETGATA